MDDLTPNQKHYRANREKRKADARAYYHAHKEAGKAVRKAWREANIDKARALSATFRERNPEYVKAYNAAYAAANSEKAVARAKAWHEAHPEQEAERKRQLSRQRRAQKRGMATVPYREQDIFERDGWLCRLCGDPLDRDASRMSPLGATIDHIIPLSRGGADAPDNVQAAHHRCNLRKHAKVA